MRQPLPVRAVALNAREPGALAAVQPERRRSYQQLRPGRFRGVLKEHAWGAAAILRECWSCGVRVRCDRPGGYVCYAFFPQLAGDARWCGAPFGDARAVRVEEPWDFFSTGPVELIAFAVDASRLEKTAAALTAGEPPAPPSRGNPLARVPDVTRVARGLRALQDALVARPPSVALARAESGLLRLAVRLARHDDASAAATYATPSRRRAAVRRIEAHLDAFPEETPTIPELCALAGVGERTLEYAFREQLGTTPVRFLRLRRLNRVRRQLMSGSAGASVTEVALRAGFLDLGRFAGDYRQLFGELPSATLRGARSILTA